MVGDSLFSPLLSVRFLLFRHFLLIVLAVGEQKQTVHNPLLRCSSIGFMEARNKQDEEIFRLISNGQKSVLIDIRPKSMIQELRNKRKGLETDSYYPLYKKEAGHPFFERHQRSAWAQKNTITGKEGSTFFLFLIRELIISSLRISWSPGRTKFIRP